MSDDDYEVGYKKPPRHSQFKKGQSGNPNGRRKKQPPEKKDMARLVRDIGEELHEVNGRRMTIDEIIVRRITNKAVSGDARSIQQYLDLRKAVGILEKERPRGGVLVVPAAPASVEEWERQASLNQAKYRERPESCDIDISFSPEDAG